MGFCDYINLDIVHTERKKTFDAIIFSYSFAVCSLPARFNRAVYSSSLLFPIMGPAVYDVKLLPIYPEHYAVLSVNSKAQKPRKIAR